MSFFFNKNKHYQYIDTLQSNFSTSSTNLPIQYNSIGTHNILSLQTFFKYTPPPKAMVIWVKINQKVVFSFYCILLYYFDLIKYTYKLIGNSTYNYLYYKYIWNYFTKIIMVY